MKLVPNAPIYFASVSNARGEMVQDQYVRMLYELEHLFTTIATARNDMLSDDIATEDIEITLPDYSQAEFSAESPGFEEWVDLLHSLVIDGHESVEAALNAGFIQVDHLYYGNDCCMALSTKNDDHAMRLAFEKFYAEN